MFSCWWRRGRTIKIIGSPYVKAWNWLCTVIMMIFENRSTLLILYWLTFPAVSCPECCSDGIKRYELKTNDIGLALCTIDVQPLGVLTETQHQGECLRACALKPNCTVYTYFFNTSRCQIGYYPLQYVPVPHCSSFALVTLSFLLSFYI